MRFIDETNITVKSGNGGNGSISFLHTHLNPLSGPDGGEGGSGGNVYFRGDSQLNSLDKFSFKRKWVAHSGSNGGKNLKKGKSGDDVYIDVPLGTIIYILEESGERKLFSEILLNNETVLASKGGKGGLGNASFKSSTNRSPRYRQKGYQTEEVKFYLELRIIADIGFVGLPSCGKSTLLNSLTNSNSKVGDFDFTTLTPQLGTAEFKEINKNLVIADLPGIIEGSTKNKGLGFKFLKHMSRCKTLIYILDSSKGINWKKDFKILKSELKNSPFKSVNEEDQKEEEILVLNKTDLLNEKEISNLRKDVEKIFPKNKFFLLSALKKENTLDQFNSFLESISHVKKEEISNEKIVSQPFYQIYDFTKSKLEIEVRKVRKSSWIVSGSYIEKISSENKSIDSFDAVISKEFDENKSMLDTLRKNGVKKGDTLLINNREYLWI